MQPSMKQIQGYKNLAYHSYVIRRY